MTQQYILKNKSKEMYIEGDNHKGITTEEVHTVIPKMNTRKSPETDDIINENNKYGIPEIAIKLTKLFQKII